MITEVDIEYASQVQGWMAVAELRWLAEQAQTHKNIVEIGCYLGRSTVALGANTTGVVLAIDDFIGPRDIPVTPAIKDNVEELFKYNAGFYINQGKIKYLKADHRTVELDLIPDMVFIDGSHIYEDIKADIEKWLPLVKSGGLICGHDFTNMYGVRKAVTELIPEAKLAKDTSIWYAKVK